MFFFFNRVVIVETIDFGKNLLLLAERVSILMRC